MLCLYWIQLSLKIISIILSILPLKYNAYKNGNYLNLLKNWKSNPINSLSISKSSQKSQIPLSHFQLEPNKKLDLNGWSNHYFILSNTENKNINYKYILKNFKNLINSLKQKSSLNIEYNDIYSIFNSQNYKMNEQLLNNILQSSNYKICGTDLMGNFLIFEDKDPCPINYINISDEEPNVNFSYNSIEINEYKKLYYSNLNIFGNIITELKINNIEICANIFKSDNFKILINSYFKNNEICEDENIDPSYIYLDSDSILNFFESNNINLEEDKFINNGKVNLYYRTFFGIINFNNNILNEKNLNLMFNSKKIFMILVVIRIVVSDFIILLLCTLIVMYIKFNNYFCLFSKYCIIAIMDILIILTLTLSLLIYYIYFTIEKIINKIMFNKILLKEFSKEKYQTIEIILLIIYSFFLIIEFIKLMIKLSKSKKSVQTSSSKTISKNIGTSTNPAIGESQMPIDVLKDTLKINNFIKTKIFSQEK